MADTIVLPPRKPHDPAMDQIVKLAVMAVGGQGGGVLTNWIEDCARLNGYAVQATSVAGVAQRTGATIYYIEMAPATDRQPVFSLMPAAGDVDILVAAEMMEAGRAIMRGFVTPDRTTLIASTHRALAVSEKTVPGDGIANSEEVLAAAEIAAQRLIAFDMEKIAIESGTVISASLFGALAGSGELPFPRDSFEKAIRASGRGVEPSLKAFSRAFEAAQAGRKELPAQPQDRSSAQPLESRGAARPVGPERLLNQWDALVQRVAALPAPANPMALRGLQAVVDYQDLAYGAEYIEKLEKIAAVDRADKEFALTVEAAKYLAKAMTYDDVIRVADLKTRGSRFERVRREIRPAKDTRMMLTEFMHPRAEEIVGLFPARIGKRFQQNSRAMRLLDRLVNRGRRLRTDRLLPYLQLHLLGGLRRWRRGTLRHAIEMEHVRGWLGAALSQSSANYDVAVEIVRNRRLIKGYSDTHARGLSKYDRVMEAVSLLAGRPDAASWIRRLRDAALLDEDGKALDGALQTVKSFAGNN